MRHVDDDPAKLTAPAAIYGYARGVARSNHGGMHMLVIWLLVLLLGVAYLAHSRTAALPALGITAAYLVAMALLSPVPGWLQLLLWIVTGAVVSMTTL